MFGLLCFRIGLSVCMDCDSKICWLKGGYRSVEKAEGHK